MQLICPSFKEYDNETSNFGDCFILWDNISLVVFDCGSEEHAKYVLNFMDKHNISTIECIILSHDDSDHVNGVCYLLEHTTVNKLCYHLLLKHAQDITDKIHEMSPQSTITKETVKDRIVDIYGNLYEVGSSNHNIELLDAATTPEITDKIKVVGPEYDKLIEIVATQVDGYQGETIDSETTRNALSVQVSIEDTQKIFLCGDASFISVENYLQDNTFDYIQAAHHGKIDFAEQVYELKEDEDFVFLISDNTGNTNGGSDKLEKEMKYCRRISTKTGTINIDTKYFTPRSTLG